MQKPEELGKFSEMLLLPEKQGGCSVITYIKEYRTQQEDLWLLLY